MVQKFQESKEDRNSRNRFWGAEPDRTFLLNLYRKREQDP